MERTRVHLWLLLLMLMSWPSFSMSQSPLATSICPLNFQVLNQFPDVVQTLRKCSDPQLQCVTNKFSNVGQTLKGINDLPLPCVTISSGLQVVIAFYLHESGFFLIPKGTSAACIDAYQAYLESQGVGVNISSSCPLNPFFSERGTDLCGNIQTAQNFTSLVSVSQLQSLNSSCSQSLQTDTACGSCQLAMLPVSSSIEPNAASSSACTAFVKMYASSILGLLNPTTVQCIFILKSLKGRVGKKTVIYIGVGVAGMLVLCSLVIFIFLYRHRHIIRAKQRKRRATDMLSDSTVPNSSINWFSIEELKKATGNFSRGNLLGSGGFGNVYKGILLDGSEIAVKRFKNCSPAGDADFVHEVEMISSVRHKHLVAIQGCCVDSFGIVDGHQRIIVYDFMPNGSLQDHLFSGMPESLLDWPTRRKIAIGTARGLAYLHNDALPAIFHRDIKSSNILLDRDFNACLADFGLAKFTPEGVSHLTTKVAGTYGYVAPEYALYGQLTAKSDVYSFGMVLLELVTGRKALSFSPGDPSRTLLSDWAWPLVQQGEWKSIVDPRMPENGPDEILERFILVALLCAHPQVFCRPSIDQALKMLENNALTVPAVPDRPLPLTSNQAEIKDALSREGHHRGFSSKTSFSAYSMSSVSSVSETHDHSYKAFQLEPTTLPVDKKSSPDRQSAPVEKLSLPDRQ